MKKNIRIAIYSRKSRFSEKGDSVGNQIEIALKYIEQHYPLDEYEIDYKIFEDDGFSGGNIDRPQFKNFLREEKENPFNVLICYRLDRISRNIADFSALMQHIAELGTSFISIKEQFDTKTPMGRAMMYIASVFAQLEREVIAERVKDNMIELAKTGRWLGGQTPTGFRSEKIKIANIDEGNKKKIASKLIIVKNEADIVKMIYQKFLKLKSLKKLETYFLQNKIESKNNLDFSTTTLKMILTNPVYAPNDKDILEYFKNKGLIVYAEGERANFDGKYGLIAYGKKNTYKENEIKDWIISVGLHKPIIKKGNTWIEVQELLEKNKEKRYRADCKHNFLLSGLLKCSECGSYMRPKVSKNGRFYYVCELKEKSRKSRCNSKNIPGHILDDLLLKKLQEIYIPEKKVYNELSKINLDNTLLDEENDRKEKIKKKIKENKKQINSLIQKLKYMDNDVINFVNDELKCLKNENETLENKLKQIKDVSIDENLKKKNIEDISKRIINNYIDSFNSLDIKSKKDILKFLIEEMEGNGQNIKVKLRDYNSNKLNL